MAENVGTGVVEIKADTTGLGKDISNKVEGERDDIGKTFGSLGTHAGKLFKAATVAAGAGAIAAIALGKQSITAASDLDESMSKIGVVFGDSADDVVKWSETSSTALGQSQQSALEAAGTYGNLFQAFGVGQKPAEEMSTSLVQLASDLASFNNTSTDEALTALQSGLSGETEPLKKYGIALSDARLKDEALRLGLIKTTKEGLTPAQKAQASYSLIMKDSTLAQGDFSRTSDGLANKQRIMSANFENLKATIGEALVPVLAVLVGWITDKLIPGIQDLAEKWGPKLAEAFNAAAPIIKGVFSALRDTVGWIFDNQPVLIGVLTAIGIGFLIWATNAALAAAATLAAIAPAIAITVAIAALVAGVIWAYQNWGFFRDAVNKVKDAVLFLWNFVLMPYIDFLKIQFAVAMAIATTAWDLITIAVRSLRSAVEWLWNNVLSPFVDFIKAGFKTGMAVAQGVFDGISGAVDWLIGRVEAVIEKLKSVIEWAKKAYDKVMAVPRAVGLGGPGVLQELVPELIPKGARGFRNFAGGMAVVGERGPELVNLPRGADVYTANRTSDMLGSSGIGVMTLVVNQAPGGADGYTFGRQILSALGDVERLAGPSWRVNGPGKSA